MNANTTSTAQYKANKARATKRMQAQYNEARRDCDYLRKAWAATNVKSEMDHYYEQYMEMGRTISTIIHVCRNSGIDLVIGE